MQVLPLLFIFLLLFLNWGDESSIIKKINKKNDTDPASVLGAVRQYSEKKLERKKA